MYQILALLCRDTDVLHPTKEGQFPRDPIFFRQTPHPQERPWSGDSETVGGIEIGVRVC